MARYRVGYEAEPLRESELAANPLAQFDAWFDEAVMAGLPEPNAIHLATCGTGDPVGPTLRAVLAKSVTADGIRFFTNTESTKGRQLAQNPAVAASFTWFPVHRQIHFLATAQPLPRSEVAAYYATRPREAQIGAWASRQSTVLTDRTDLQQRYDHFAHEFADQQDAINVPPYWGGYLLRPHSVEFWQGQPSRLHDRLRFVAQQLADPPLLSASEGWKVERLSP